ncbi:MAG: MraY family glycosyltransferase [Burkholderiales bacterium]
MSLGPAIAPLAAAAAIVVLARLARPLGLVDHPGGRKTHAREVPVVGGIAVFLATVACTALAGVAIPLASYLAAAALMVAIGAWDDRSALRPRWRFGAQVGAAAIMVFGAGIELQGVGDLLGLRPIGLWVLAAPLTIFAVVGVINAVNMIDGMDGLSGLVSLAALGWYAAVALGQGQRDLFLLAAIVAGAVAAFLVFNLRTPWQAHARVFLGDAGSMMIGLTLAWLAVDLTQGPGRSFPPICALWVILLPLADCVSLMTRRAFSGRSPFSPDREHIHHYLLARGLSVNRTTWLLAAVSTAFGAVGYFGWRLGVPEPVLFGVFFFAYFAYHFAMKRAWRRRA